MLIKVMTQENTYTIFDKAEEISFDDRPNIIHSQEDYAQFINFAGMRRERSYIGSSNEDIRVQHLEEDRDYNNALTSDGIILYSVTFKRDGVYQAIIFDRYAYICDDNGKTINRIGDKGHYVIPNNIDWSDPVATEKTPASGSGADIALGAMLMGATAKQAVQ